MLGYVIDMVQQKFVFPQEKRVAVVDLLGAHALTVAAGKGVT